MLSARHFSCLIFRLNGRSPLHHGPLIDHRVHQIARMLGRHQTIKPNCAQALQLELECRGPFLEPGKLPQDEKAV